MEKFAHQFVRTDGFEKIIAFEMTLTKAIWQAMQEKKNFRMVLEYDAEALNVNIDFEEMVEESTDEFLARLKEEFGSEEHKNAINHFHERCLHLEANRDKGSKDSEKS